MRWTELTEAKKKKLIRIISELRYGNFQYIEKKLKKQINKWD